MNDKPRPDIIGPEQLISCMPGDGGAQQELADLTMELLNKLRLFVAPIRQSDPVHYDGPLITALVALAGGIHGELLAMGMCADLTPEAVARMLSLNWYSGVAMGERHVNGIAAQEGLDAVTGRPPQEDQG